MINYIKRLIVDWKTFRMIRNKLDVLDPIDNQDIIRYIVNRYSEKDEQNINSLLLHSLMRELVKDNINSDAYRWYLMALEHREMLFRNNRKLINIKQ